MTLPPTSFQCQCAQKCERCVSWLARAPEAQCYQDAESCECSCHAMAEELAEHRRMHVDARDNHWNNHA